MSTTLILALLLLAPGELSDDCCDFGVMAMSRPGGRLAPRAAMTSDIVDDVICDVTARFGVDDDSEVGAMLTGAIACSNNIAYSFTPALL